MTHTRHATDTPRPIEHEAFTDPAAAVVQETERVVGVHDVLHGYVDVLAFAVFLSRKECKTDGHCRIAS